MTNDTTMEAASAELPRYRCHKKVWALEIAKLEEIDSIDPSGPVAIHFVDDGYAPIDVAGNTMFARYWPKPGDFYVVYPAIDGEVSYVSISPRKAFLDGYTRIT